MKRGLVIGKFYPPHAGHKSLIQTALKGCDRLTVAVCHREDQRIPGELRARWLREIHPQAEVMVVKDLLLDDDSKAWADYTREFLGYAPEVVFTSEDYGRTYATFLGAEHVLVDKERARVPVSATLIRKDPLGHLDLLEPCVRAHFVRRVCVVGAESSGTTTLAKALADHFRTVWVPEFGRTYSEAKLAASDLPWKTEEFTFIARQQNSLEDRLAGVANRILICDTDAFATRLWHERYMGSWSVDVDRESEGRRKDLYLLTDVDIPFVQDGTRDGEHIRSSMHSRFMEELGKKGDPYLLLSGPHEERMRSAVHACDGILSKPFLF
jgi:NadR type nicotinamide-nucleotide adenylyltransferase